MGDFDVNGMDILRRIARTLERIEANQVSDAKVLCFNELDGRRMAHIRDGAEEYLFELPVVNLKMRENYKIEEEEVAARLEKEMEAHLNFLIIKLCQVRDKKLTAWEALVQYDSWRSKRVSPTREAIREELQ